ncbi:hypothetical protein Plhal304r1_c031g0101261 [Plasmopara halstedii]
MNRSHSDSLISCRLQKDINVRGRVIMLKMSFSHGVMCDVAPRSVSHPSNIISPIANIASSSASSLLPGQSRFMLQTRLLSKGLCFTPPRFYFEPFLFRPLLL